MAVGVFSILSSPSMWITVTLVDRAALLPPHPPPLGVELEVEGGGRGGKGRDRRVRAAHRQAEPVVLAAPAGGEVGEAREEELPLVRRQPRYEIRPLAEHVEQVEHGQHHVQVEAGQKRAEVLHRAVEVAVTAGWLDVQGTGAEGSPGVSMMFSLSRLAPP